jgi:hypothetical protein
MRAGLAYSYALAGEIEKSKEIRDEMIELVKEGHMYQGALATVYVGLKEKDLAMECLEAVYEQKEAMMYIIRAWYEDYLGTDLLSDDPRFNEIQKTIGLE